MVGNIKEKVKTWFGAMKISLPQSAYFFFFLWYDGYMKGNGRLPTDFMALEFVITTSVKL